MVEKVEHSKLWLSSEFLGKDFFLEESRIAALMGEIERGACLGQEYRSPSSLDTKLETESNENDYIVGLTRQMANSFLAEDKTSFWDDRVMAMAQQSNLSDAGGWSVPCTARPNGVSKLSSPLLAYLEQRKDDALDLLCNEAAVEFRRKKQNEQRVHAKSSAAAGFYNKQVLARQQLQEAQFYKLKQQQLIKQQLSSAWSRQNRAAAAKGNQPHGLAPSAWPHLQRQQPSSGTRRESAGTGVFLPRRAESPTESRKNPACSTVLLPARVVQALNLTLDDTGLQTRYPLYISCDQEMASARGKPGHHEQKRNVYHSSPANISGHEIRLPKEWTY